MPPIRLIRALLCLALSVDLTCAMAQQLATNEFIAVQQGNLPVILSAPHGGQREIPGVAPRKGKGLEKGPRGFVTSRDGNVDQLAFELAAPLELKLGKKPYFVVAKFHRKFIDANRPADIAFEDTKARAVYEGYHGALSNSCAEAVREFGYALVLDIHGQAPAPDTVFRGTQNGQTDRWLAKQWGEKAHSGPESLCGLLAAQGIEVFPTNNAPEKSGFGGGYIVRTCGERESIGAIQLEFGSVFRRKENLKATAAKLADGIAEFIRLHPLGQRAAARVGETPAPAATPVAAAADDRGHLDANGTWIETEAQRDRRMAWWREARFGMFIHWGLYSVTAGQWQGKPQTNKYGEWIQIHFKIPVKEYETLATRLNPAKFDADAWVCLAAGAGMKYIVITSKHHEGFAMFRTKASRTSPFPVAATGSALISRNTLIARPCRRCANC